MKVSIVTVVFNCDKFIRHCIESVLGQDYADIEYIMIDGGSTDCTLKIIDEYEDRIDRFYTGKDSGMYDALNKGIGMCTGDIIGVLNADDCLASLDVISSIVACFSENGCEAVYGNLIFTKRYLEHKTIRNWRSHVSSVSAIRYGWMPPHPTLYVRKKVLSATGEYSVKFGSCADYDMILRLFYVNRINAVFLNRIIVVMRSGGMSNGSIKKLALAMKNDYRILVSNKIPYPLIAVILKKVRKLNQFFGRSRSSFMT